MTTKSDVWDVEPGKSRCDEFKVPGDKRAWVLFRYCTPGGTPYATVARDRELACTKRDVWMDNLCLTVPKPEPKPKPKPERIPLSECCEPACNCAVEAADPQLARYSRTPELQRFLGAPT